MDPDALIPSASGALVLLLVLSGSPWRLARHAITIAHEGGHALAAVLVGRRLRGITLHSDTSGLTVSRGRPNGPGMVFTLLSGYPAPALIGLLFAALIAAGRSDAVLIVAGVGVVGVLLAVRNLFGAFTVLVTAAVLAAVKFYGTPEVADAFVYAVTWFLLLGAVRPIAELRRERRRRGARDSDADQLARLTKLPAPLWLLVLAILALGCLILGGSWLLEPVLR